MLRGVVEQAARSDGSGCPKVDEHLRRGGRLGSVPEPELSDSPPLDFGINPLKTSPGLIADLVTAVSQGMIVVGLGE